MKIKFKLTWRIWLLIIFVGISLLAIFGFPPVFLEKGVLITSVESNSTAFEQGLRKGQIITEIDGQKINDIEDFSKIMQEKFPSNENVKTIIKTKDSELIFYSKDLDVTVSDIPNSNLKTGLDLTGGSRALVQAEDKKLSQQELNDLIEITKNRFNEFGLTDIRVLSVSDLAGNRYMAIEIAGATPQDLEKLISEQGKFEAKIGNETAFVGGKKDITSVTRGGQEAGIYSCSKSQEGYFCNFRFTVYLSEEAAKRHAEITKNLEVNSTPDGNYLSKKLDLYLDDKLVDSLLISEDLRGHVTTQVQISGFGNGATESDAIKDAEEKMKHLQTILITGSLPFQLEIVKLDTISPTLGREFSKVIFIAGIATLLAIFLIIFLRYRKIKSSFYLLIISLSEVIIILGISAIMRIDLDLPALAGILTAIGTGVDDQIVILDEARGGKILSIKQRIKRAFTIIIGAYITTFASLIPLFWAVAGMFKGFAITTIIGISVGVLITRPAFGEMVKRIEE